MKESLFLAVVLVILSFGSALAAPLDDYSKAGNVGISIYVLRSDMEDGRKANNSRTFEQELYNRSFSYGDKWNWGGEMTVSFAPKWAVAFEYSQAKNQKYRFASAANWDEYMSSRLKSTNIKLKYQAYKDERLFIAPYLGYSLNKLEQNELADYTKSGFGFAKFDIETKRKSNLLAGVTLVYNLDKQGKFKTYFDSAVGSKVYSWNLGFSYAVAKNLDLDFGYKCYRVKGLKYNYPETTKISSNGSSLTWGADYGEIKNTSKGIYFGLSYNFK